MNPILLYFASGESLYPGALLLFLAVGISLCTLPRWPRPLLNIAAWMGLILMVMACPPFSWTVDAIFGASFFLWLVGRSSTSATHAWLSLRVASTAVLTALLLVLSTVEFLHRRVPVIGGEASDHLVVIGDSISAGLGAKVRPWPDVMQQVTGVEARNLSRAGATAADGLALADRVGSDDRLVRIELGGNDLLGGEESGIFARALERVLAKLAVPGRTLVMFELPLLPSQVGYGRIQRRLAAKYGVWLIPKRFLMGVIAGREATSDGLHLSDIGARRMASIVAEVLSPVLKSQIGVPTTPATRP